MARKPLFRGRKPVISRGNRAGRFRLASFVADGRYVYGYERSRAETKNVFPGARRRLSCRVRIDADRRQGVRN